MPWVTHPGRIREIMVFGAAVLLEPEYEVDGIVISNEDPPYPSFEGIPEGWGRAAPVERTHLGDGGRVPVADCAMPD